MAITPAIVRALAGEARGLIDRCKDAPRGIDGEMAVLAMRRGWRGAHGRNQPPAAAAVTEAKSIGRIRTAPA